MTLINIEIRHTVSVHTFRTLLVFRTNVESCYLIRVIAGSDVPSSRSRELTNERSNSVEEAKLADRRRGVGGDGDVKTRRAVV